MSSFEPFLLRLFLIRLLDFSYEDVDGKGWGRKREREGGRRRENLYKGIISNCTPFPCPYSCDIVLDGPGCFNQAP